MDRQQIIDEFENKIKNAPNNGTREALIKQRDQILTQFDAQQTQNKMGALSDKLLDPNSSYYKQYQSYLQKTMPGIGVNSLLAPLMAGGTGYAGGQAIAQQKMQGMNRERQDKINTGVQGFALGNLNVGANLLGQQGNLQLGYANLNEQKRQYDDQNSGWGDFGKMLGSAGGFLLGNLLFPGVGGAIGGAVAGYGSGSSGGGN